MDNCAFVELCHRFTHRLIVENFVHGFAAAPRRLFHITFSVACAGNFKFFTLFVAANGTFKHWQVQILKPCKRKPEIINNSKPSSFTKKFRENRGQTVFDHKKGGLIQVTAITAVNQAKKPLSLCFYLIRL